MKRKITIEAPIDYYSGYSAKARDFVMSLISLDYDVEVVNSPWYGYQKDFLKDNGMHQILQRLSKKVYKPDVYICIDSPARFFRKGKTNIGVTAGIETDRCNAAWFKKLNQMDLVMVPSNHSKNVFINSQKGKNKLTVPVEVLFEGINTDIYCRPKRTKLSDYLDALNTDFVFLFVGQWLPADGDNDRKNVSGMIRYFLKTFHNNQHVALLLKTAADNSTFARIETEEKIEEIIEETRSNAAVYNLHGSLTDEQMSELYHHPKIAAMVSFTRGEGFGRPLLEFSLAGKPIVATNWSGQLDFLDQNGALLVGGELQEVHKSIVNADIIKGAKWMNVGFEDARDALTDAVLYYDFYKRQAELLAARNTEKFSHRQMTAELGKIIDNYK